MAKNGNKALGDAKKQKKDEFYTQLADINAELRHYTQHFAGKVVFCNCDDPYESNFFKYFAANFNALKLKRLIATCYAGSPMAGRQLELDLFGSERQTDLLRPNGLRYSEMESAVGANKSVCSQRIPHKIVINEVKDVNGDGRIDLADVEWLIKNDKNVLTRLEGNGDFRSAECVELLKQSDVVVTNPPFSLFREYVAQLIQYGKKFLIIGRQDAVTYKEIFPLIRSGKIWLGHGFPKGNAYFAIPKNNVRDFANGVYDGETGLVKFRNCTWFTNLDHKKRHEEYVSVRKYNPTDYPQLDNFDATLVEETVDIPEDFEGNMAVPFSFLDRHNPNQFEIIGITKAWDGGATKKYPKQIQVDANGNRSNVSKLNDGAVIRVETPPKGKTYYLVNGVPYVQRYPRIIIRRKK